MSCAELSAGELAGVHGAGAFVMLEELPLTPNGKVDRRRCRRRRMAEARAKAYEAPRTPIEEIVAGIWSEVLGVERVGVERQLLRAGRAFAAGDAGDLASAGGVRGGAAAAGAVRGADGGELAEQWSRRCGGRGSGRRRR